MKKTDEFNITEAILKSLESSQEERKIIDKEIWSKYGMELNIFISDMSGFSKITEKSGIIHFLGMILKQREITIPIIEKNNGTVVKTEADNIFAYFENSDDAVKASIEIHKKNSEFNKNSVIEHDISVCHGISFGKILNFGKNAYGHAVNIASKLGEDLSDPGELLITDKVFGRLSEDNKRLFEQYETEISSVKIIYYKYKVI